MRTVRILAILAFAALLHAQPREKVAIVLSPYYPTALDTTVMADVSEPVEIDSILPANLGEYDALFVQLDFNLDSTIQSQLVKYIDSGGKLYLVDGYYSQNPVDSSNPLWQRIGITHNEITAGGIYVDSVYGTEFASNIFSGFEADLIGIGVGGPIGSITPVLFAGGLGSWQALAYIPKDSSIRVVMGPGASDPNWPGNYFSDFITDVVCNYFNLCAEYVQPAPQIISTDNISIVHDSRYRGYSISADVMNDGDVSVFNSLGVVVWRANVQAGENLIELPLTLRNGLYFVSLRSGDKSGSARFAVVN